MKFKVHVELCSQLSRLATTLLLGWIREVSGVPAYGTDKQQLEHDFGPQIIGSFDWLIDHGETQWKAIREQTTRRFEVEFIPLVRPLVSLGPGRNQDPYELGIEQDPLQEIEIARLIILSEYALDDLDRVAGSIPDEEWLLPLCQGRVIAAIYSDLVQFEMFLVSMLKAKVAGYLNGARS